MSRPTRARGHAVGRKRGRPSKGARVVVNTKLPEFALEQVARLVDTKSVNQSDAVAALIIVGINHRSQLRSALAKLPTHSISDEGLFSDSDAPGTTLTKPVWTRVPDETADMLGTIQVRERLSKTDCAAGLALLGLEHPEEFDTGLTALEKAAMSAARESAPEDHQEVLSMAM